MARSDGGNMAATGGVAWGILPHPYTHVVIWRILPHVLTGSKKRSRGTRAYQKEFQAEEIGNPKDGAEALKHIKTLNRLVRER